STDEFSDLLRLQNRSTTQRMAEALLANAGKTNTSPAGNILNGLAWGLMGIYDAQDEKARKADASNAIGSEVQGISSGLSPSPAPSSQPPAPVSAAPDVAPSKSATVRALMGSKEANDFYDSMPGPTRDAAPIAEDVKSSPVIDRSSIAADLQNNAPKLAFMLN